MANGSLINNQGKGIILYRGYTENLDLSGSLRTAPSQFKVGISNGTPSVTSTELDYEVPILDGTVNDGGDNLLTGSSGGDNSTDNTVTFKEGAGVADVTAQNLIANGSNVTKIWTITNLASAGTNITSTEPFALWLYIKDATALAKFLSAGTCLTVKLGSDTSNYFYKTWTAANLVVGWNWITSNTVNVEDLSETGTVAGDIDTFIIEIITNNAADAFVAGDVIYDLLRQWAISDLISNFSAGYPTFNYTNKEVTIRCYVNSIQANGFLINSLGIYNKDTIPLLAEEDTFAGESKSSTDEFSFVIVNRIS